MCLRKEDQEGPDTACPDYLFEQYYMISRPETVPLLLRGPRARMHGKLGVLGAPQHMHNKDGANANGTGL